MKQLRGWWAADRSPHLEIVTPRGDLLDLIVDSGFNGQLMLPEPLLMQLGFVRRGAIDLELADGSVVRSETYYGDILWFGQQKRVRVQATDHDEGLLGTELFQGCIVELDLDANRVIFCKKTTRTSKR